MRLKPIFRGTENAERPTPLADLILLRGLGERDVALFEIECDLSRRTEDGGTPVLELAFAIWRRWASREMKAV
jgi:hypothetical protein